MPLSKEQSLLPSESYSFPKDLKEFQKEALEYLDLNLSCMVVAPTGSGKSLCYQKFAQLSGFVVVISPLLSLIRDQQEKSKALGLNVASYHHLVGEQEQGEILNLLKQKKLDVLFTTPESMASAFFSQCIRANQPQLLVIDEAHCIEEWGFSFRPNYRKLGTYLELHNISQVLVLSATLTKNACLSIKKLLNREQMPTIYLSPIRENIQTDVVRFSTVIDQQQEVLRAATEGGQSIVYAATVKIAQKTEQVLRSSGLKTALYFSGMSLAQKKSIESDFSDGRVQVLVSTKAYSLGIDNKFINTVVHAGLPANIEQYLQDSGRAGRDGSLGKSYVFYTTRDIQMGKFMLQRSFPDPDMMATFYKFLDVAISGNPAHEVSRSSVLEEISKNMDIKEKLIEPCLDLLVREGLVQEFMDGHSGEKAYSFVDSVLVEDMFWAEYASKRRTEFLKADKMLEFFTLDSHEARLIYLEEYFG